MDIKEYLSSDNACVHNHPWEHGRFFVINKILIKHFQRKEGTIVDIGCGDTFFLEELSRYHEDYQLYGIDIALDDEILKKLKDKLSKKNIIIKNNYDDFYETRVKADVVLLLDVIEHIEKDFEFLEDILASPLWKEDTLLYITVPAFQLLFSKHDEWLEHYRRYNLKKLTSLMDKLNLQVVEKRYFFASLLLARSLKVIKENVFKVAPKKVTGIGNWKSNKTKDSIIKKFLIIDFLFSNFLYKLGIKLPGLSCLIVAKKR
jgi:trans-aconitate methyltransferase